VTSGTRPIEAVVFDMDGVLIDSEPIWRAVERRVLARVGIHVTDQDLERTMGVPIQEVVEQWHRRRPWDEPDRREIVRAIVEGVAEAVEREVALNPGAREAVRYFRKLGLRLALASSSPRRLIDAVLALSGLAEAFEVVLSAEEEERGKPDPAVYLSAARELGIPAERCLAVEDSINGVRSATAAGMVCVAVPGASSTDPTFGGADLVLGSLRELDDRVWAATGTAPIHRQG
jgi:HAD superfamily hydrolase (TIGR01509 family)